MGNRIFKFNLSRPEGTVDTFAGHVNSGYADGIGTSALFHLVSKGCYGCLSYNSDGDLAVTAKGDVSLSQTHGTTVWGGSISALPRPALSRVCAAPEVVTLTD